METLTAHQVGAATFTELLLQVLHRLAMEQGPALPGLVRLKLLNCLLLEHGFELVLAL